MYLSKKTATAIAELIESNYGEFIDIMERMEKDAQGNAMTFKDPSYEPRRKEMAEVVDSLLRRLNEAK